LSTINIISYFIFIIFQQLKNIINIKEKDRNVEDIYRHNNYYQLFNGDSTDRRGCMHAYF